MRISEIEKLVDAVMDGTTIVMIPLDKRASEHHVGIIPTFLDLDDPRKACVQFNDKYSFGGGWRPHSEDKWKLDQESLVLRYPGDPIYPPMVAIPFRDELIVVYDYAIVMILQKDGSFEVSRMD
jgi:hypothetical protein